MSFNADTLLRSNPATNEAGLVSLQQAAEAGGAVAGATGLAGLFQASLPGLLFGLLDPFGRKEGSLKGKPVVELTPEEQAQAAYDMYLADQIQQQAFGEEGAGEGQLERLQDIYREAVDVGNVQLAEQIKETFPEEEVDVFADTTAMDIPDLGIEPTIEDPEKVFKEKAGEDLDLKGIIDLAFDVFGAYNRDAISNVVDIVNQRGISVQDVAQATGNTVESINKAAAESGTAIKNQGPVTVDAGPAIGPQQPITVDAGPAIGPIQTPETPDTPDDIDNGQDDAGDDKPDDKINVDPEPTILDPSIYEPPPRPEPFFQIPEIPKPTRQGLFAVIQNTPVTEQMFAGELFETKLRELTNVPEALGMIQDIGRRFV